MSKHIVRIVGSLLLSTIAFPFASLSQQTSHKAPEMNDKPIDMNIVRTFEAPLEKTWEAWSNAESIKLWWGPEGFTAPVAQVDFREGGVTLVSMRSPDGFEIYNSWTYKRIVPMYSIEFVQHFTDKDGKRIDPADIGLPPGIPYEVPHTIIFKDLGNGHTEINITEYGYGSAETAAISKEGMNSVLNKLAETLRGNDDTSFNRNIAKSLDIDASLSRVWHILTNPNQMRQWLGGASITSEWKQGSAISFTGNWNGKEYADKGAVLQFEREKVFQYSYWSIFSGLPDKPAHYSIIRFDLKRLTDDKTTLVLAHRNIATQQMHEHSETNWRETLDLIRKMAEAEDDTTTPVN